MLITYNDEAKVSLSQSTKALNDSRQNFNLSRSIISMITEIFDERAISIKKYRVNFIDISLDPL